MPLGDAIPVALTFYMSLMAFDEKPGVNLLVVCQEKMVDEAGSGFLQSAPTSGLFALHCLL